MLEYFWCSGPFWMQSSLDIYYVFQIHFWHVLLCRSIKMTPKTVTKAKSEFLFQTLLPFPSFSHFSRCDPFFSSLAFLFFLSLSIFIFLCRLRLNFSSKYDERDWGWKWWLTSDLEAFFTSFWKEQAYEVNFLLRLGFAMLLGW